MGILILLAIGFIIGLLLRAYKGVYIWSARITNILIYILLFFVGFSLAFQPAIIDQLFKLTLVSMLISIFTLAFSMILVYFMSKLLNKYKNT